VVLVVEGRVVGDLDLLAVEAGAQAHLVEVLDDPDEQPAGAEDQRVRARVREDLGLLGTDLRDRGIHLLLEVRTLHRAVADVLGLDRQPRAAAGARETGSGRRRRRRGDDRSG